MVCIYRVECTATIFFFKTLFLFFEKKIEKGKQVDQRLPLVQIKLMVCVNTRTYSFHIDKIRYCKIATKFSPLFSDASKQTKTIS